MSGPACGVCGAAACCRHLFHTGDENDDFNSRRALFSVFPAAVHHHEPSPSSMQQQPPAGCLHEFQFFGHQDNDDHQESIAWLFDHPPPPAHDVESTTTTGPQLRTSSLITGRLTRLGRRETGSPLRLMPGWASAAGAPPGKQQRQQQQAPPS